MTATLRADAGVVKNFFGKFVILDEQPYALKKWHDQALPPTAAPPKIGVREIAKRVGVSPITVSRLLSKPDLVSAETRKKLFNAIEQTEFVPNQLASSMRDDGRMIGTVVVPLINSGIAEQIQGMSDECHEGGYSMLLAQGEFTQAAKERAIRTLIGWRPAGFVLQSFVQSKPRGHCSKTVQRRWWKSPKSRAKSRSKRSWGFPTSRPRMR